MERDVTRFIDDNALDDTKVCAYLLASFWSAAQGTQGIGLFAQFLHSRCHTCGRDVGQG